MVKLTPKGGCVMCELDVCAHKGSAMKDILKGGCKIALGITLFVLACEAVTIACIKLEN
jgi:hypothetical protein